MEAPKTAEERLIKWIGALDAQIGDTEVEIAKRRENNAYCVSIREDLKELMEYMKNNDMPSGARRALERALSWSPYA